MQVYVCMLNWKPKDAGVLENRKKNQKELGRNGY